MESKDIYVMIVSGSALALSVINFIKLNYWDKKIKIRADLAIAYPIGKNLANYDFKNKPLKMLKKFDTKYDLLKLHLDVSNEGLAPIYITKVGFQKRFLFLYWSYRFKTTNPGLPIKLESTQFMYIEIEDDNLYNSISRNQSIFIFVGKGRKFNFKIQNRNKWLKVIDGTER